MRGASPIALLAVLAACGGGGGGGAPRPSDDARLVGLAVSPGALEPAFDPEGLAYAVAVDAATAEVTLAPTAAHARATVAVAGQPVASGTASAPVAVPVGETTIAVDVTAEDGVTRRRYDVAVRRAAPPAPAAGPRLFSPFVDAGLWPVLGALSDEVLDAQGIRHAHLGFVVENAWSALEPAWAGVYGVGSVDPVTGDAPFLAGIDRVRSRSGDVVVSFGGAAGLELAAAYSRAGRSATDLQQAYQAVIDRYDLVAVDFDIEGFHVADAASVALRSTAIRGLQVAAAAVGRVLRVSLTLPVMPAGLDANGLAVLRSALAAGVVLDCVNIMCMDYGAGVADMGGAAIAAAESLVAQLQTLDPTKTRAAACRMVGLTPMIGRNDTIPETFTLEDAAEVAAWADANDIRLLSLWSLNRDHAGTGVSPTSSGIAQDDFAFTKVFAPFAR
jgi:chitinase